MDNFIVSARKYRPATFDMVVGQDSITSTLKNAIKNNHLAQAFLFCGPRGVGKTTCARILAKTINCFHPTEKLEPCDKCESCVSFNGSASFNIHELDAASNNSVDDIRNLVDQVRIPPQVGQYKVYIIDEVHMLSQSAFNAFLKTLEEPPAYAKFILATTEKHKIIPTILSRCQIFDFKRITVKDIAGYLTYVADKEGVKVEEEALHIIAQKADGALRDALSFFDQLVSYGGKELTYEMTIDHLNVLDHTYYFKIVDYLLSGDSTNTLLTINEIIDRGFDGQHFIVGLGEHLRNLLVCKDPKTVSLLEVSSGIMDRYADQASVCQPDFLIRALETVNTCDVNYKSSNNKRLHIELSLLKICSFSGVSPSSEYQGLTLPAPGMKAANRPVSKATAKPAPAQKNAGPGPGKPEPEPGKPGTEDPGTEIPRTETEDPVTEIPQTETEDPVTETPVTETGKPETAIVEDSGADEVKPAPARKYRSGAKTISIRPENHHTEKKAGHDENGLPDSNGTNKDFSQEQLDKVWKYFTESIAKQYPNFYSTVSGRKLVKKEDFAVEITVDNKVQEMHISDRVKEVLDFLRAELENHKIILSANIVEKEVKGKAYVPEEKFKEMVEKNPSLKDLKDTLELDLEY